MTRVKLFPADLGGCGYYRIIWPGQALAAQVADEADAEFVASLRDRWADEFEGDEFRPTLDTVLVEAA